MGVMKCDRNDCDNILCNRCILGGTHYICESCYDELLDYKQTWQPPMSAIDVKNLIIGFMETHPGTFLRLNTECDINVEFERLT